MKLSKMLKQAIIEWLIEHETEFNRVNACHTAFYPLIYDTEGNYLECGEAISEFIVKADKLIYEE